MPEDYSFRKLSFDDKMRVLPGMICDFISSILSPEERAGFIIEVDIHEVKK